jgi:hypothetical protein
MSVIVVDAILPIGGTGTFTITDTTAAAIGFQTTELEKLFGSAAVSAGGLTSIVSGQAKSIKDINDKLSTLIGKFSSLETAVVNINKGQADILTALANMHYVAIETKTIQTMAFIDQAENNQFQQKATNQALVDAGKPPIVVEPAEFEASTKKSVVAIGTLNAQVAGTNIVQDYVTGALTKGIAISQNWIAQTAVGKFVTDYYAIGKLKTQLIFADETAKLKIQDEINTIYARLTNPSAPK